MTVSELFQIGLYHGYILQILLAESLFTLALHRKKHFWVRLAVGLPVYLVLSVVVPNLIAHYMSGLFSMTIFLLSFGLCCLLFANKLADILYCCVCAQLTQNLSYNMENLICLPFGEELNVYVWLFISLVTMVAVYTACYLIFSHRKRNSDEINMGGQYVFPIAIITMLFVYTMQYLLQVYGINMIWVSRPPLIVCCLFGLCLQYGLLAYKDEREENIELEYFLRQANQQYEAAKANIDLINMKAHDLKHYIRRVRELSGGEELQEIEDVVGQYEKTIRCGNSTLDVILTDKLYQCRSNAIDFSIMVQGEELDFISPSDLVSIFSNALDNAIECELGIAEEARRCIALKVFRKGAFICIHVENYCTKHPELRDGLPITTKEDKGLHGFGTKSMRYVTEKYSGFMQAETQGNMFVLNILIPVPDGQQTS